MSIHTCIYIYIYIHIYIYIYIYIYTQIQMYERLWGLEIERGSRSSTRPRASRSVPSTPNPEPSNNRVNALNFRKRKRCTFP